MPDSSLSYDPADHEKSFLLRRKCRVGAVLLGVSFLSLLIGSCRNPTPSESPILRIAVASNFHSTAQKLAAGFEENSPCKIVLSPGSTGKHYAQIVSGAPFDLFLAADAERPSLLEEKGIGVPATRSAYARGRLVLLAKEGAPQKPWEMLTSKAFEHIAIANPKLAPYGRAAEEVLIHLEMEDSITDRLVTGENVAQAWHFLESGHADLAFVALSQLIEQVPDWEVSERSGLVPLDWHTPITQELLLLRDTPCGREFLRFLESEEARQIIGSSGYATADSASESERSLRENAP